MPFDEELIVIAGKDQFLSKMQRRFAVFSMTLKRRQLYLDKPKEARQILIDAKMVRIVPDVA